MKSRDLTRREVIDILNNLEKKYSVESWVINDIHVWPLLKKEIFFKWFYSKKTNNKSLDKKNIKNEVKKLIEIISSAFCLLKLYFIRCERRSIMLIGASSHRIFYNNSFINRYFQPVIEYLKKCNKSYVSIEYSTKDSSKIYPEGNNLIFIKKYLPFVRIYNLLVEKEKKQNLPGFSSFITDVNNNIDGLYHIDFYKLLHVKVGLIKQYAFIYDKLLRIFNPKSVLCLCYYDTSVYGLNYSAYKLGIKTIDMQHGGQGELHVAYSGFSKVPKQGYNILPQTFWSWDNASKATIQRWVINQDFHNVEVSGNPWLSYSISSSEYKFPSKKIILYTMQFEELEEFIIQAIKLTPADYEWWLRMHPRKISSKTKILDIIKENNLQAKVEIDKANEYPLPNILNRSIVHISRFSGSVIEATEFKVISIIIDETGVETYGEYIINNQAVALLNESAEDLLNLILNIDYKVRLCDYSDKENYKELVDKIC